MNIKIFGIKGCPACQKAKQKVEYYLSQWQATVPLEYYDLETAEGLAVGAFHDVSEVPTVILEEEGRELHRWVKFPPRSEELKECIL